MTGVRFYLSPLQSYSILSVIIKFQKLLSMNKNFYAILLLAIFIAGCKPSIENSQNTHEEEIKFKLTAYSNDFELFAEADPFLVGKTSGILSHFSHLPGFKALENGSVKIRLMVGNSEVSQMLDKPTRKGIYKFELKPELQGSGQLVFDIKIDQNDYQVIVPDITVYPDDQQSLDAASKIIIPGTNAVAFTKEQSWKIDFATEYPDTGTFGQVIKTTAQVQSAQEDEQIITAKTKGMVMFSKNEVVDGLGLSQGQVIFIISGSGLADNNSTVRYAEAQNNYERTKADYERLKELSKDKIVSEKDLLNAKNEYDNASAVFNNLNNNFSSGEQAVKSPLKGFIKHVFVSNGQFVEAGQPLLTVSQNQTLLLHADVQQKYAHLLSAISTANIRSLQNNLTFTLSELQGKVLSYGKNANTDNYLVPVILQIENNGSFIPGGFVELYLQVISTSSALTVPNEAVLEDQGNYFVFVQTNPELFEKREVKIGSTDGLRTEITKGISIADRIVTKGAVLVKLAQASGALDAHSGHNH
jgi:RND family efflux transporter MFP subunit